MNKNKRIRTALVVDDNQEVLSLFVELLEMKHFRVVGKGRSGEEAVELYRILKPDVTFLDVAMNNGDGIYALEKIRDINSEALVIMVTNEFSSVTAERLEALKASAVIYKPFEIDDILNIVQELESESNINQMKFFN